VRCPSPVELERAFWSQDAAVGAHATECRRCGDEWAEIGALADAARRLAAPPAPPQRAEELRTALVSREVAPPTGRRAAATRVLVPLLAAAAVAVAWWGWPDRDVPPPAAPAQHGHVLAHDGARYLVAGLPPDEIIRLVSGTVTVEVGGLAPGERLRVITGDAEIDASDAALDVAAAGDRLTAVRVMRGVVLLAAAGDAVVLSPGMEWRPSVAKPPAPAPQPPPAPAAPARARSRHARAIEAPAEIAAPEPDAGVPVAPPRIERSVAQRDFDAGWAAIRAGAFARAADAFERAAAAGDWSVAEDAAFWRAVALARAAEPADAAQAFARFLDDFPDSPRAGEASVMLGWLLYERGDLAGAGRRFRAAVEDPSERVWRSALEGVRAIDARE